MRGRGQGQGGASGAPAKREFAPMKKPLEVRQKLIEATVQHIIWKKQDDDFAIARVFDETNGQPAIVKGAIGNYEPGASLRMEGYWAYDMERGWQYQAETFDKSEPHDRAELLIWMEELELEMEEGELATIAQAWKAEAVEKIQANPYDIVPLGFTFADADVFADTMGITGEDPRRMRAALDHVLLINEEEGGHTYTDEKTIKHQLKDLLELNKLPNIKQALTDDASVTLIDGKVYRTSTYTQEHEVAQLINKMIRRPSGTAGEEVLPPLGEDGFELTDEQKQAVIAAHNHPLSVITGGPGVGKTATLCKVVESLEAEGQTYILCSPTGKAAKRMTETTGRDASTMHSMLGWEYVSDITDEMPDPINVDVIIVDETSMLDQHLAKKFFDRVGPNTRVVLVGDVDQLPAVGTGSVFHDIIASEQVPTTRLTKTFRQGAGSLLLHNAQRVRDGEMPFWSVAEAEKALGEKVLPDFSYHPQKDAKDTVEAVYKYAKENENTMVISPTRHGKCGVNNLNVEFQTRDNPQGKDVLLKEEYSVRSGDRILITKNNRQHKIVNGDLGYLVTGNEETGLVTFKVDGKKEMITMSIGQAEKMIDLGYVLTIHKSQGSQASQVVCPLQEGSAEHMLSRNLIYTAWTRGQSKCVVIGPESAVEKALDIIGTDRNTGLAELIQAA